MPTQPDWLEGHRTRLNNDWVWVPGRWTRPSYAGARWVPGHWVHRPRGWVWVPGHWERR